MHDLIKENQIVDGKSHDFGAETPPTLDPKKGAWVPRTTINPNINPETQIKTLVKTVNEDSTTWEYVVSDIAIETIKARIQAQNKADCKAFILSKYTEETQRNAALGLYSEAITTAMADHVARIIAEEDRVFDILEASADPYNEDSPAWPEV